MVLLADHARLGSQATTEGTTIYNGDRLSTEVEGSILAVEGWRSACVFARQELRDASQRRERCSEGVRGGARIGDGCALGDGGKCGGNRREFCSDSTDGRNARCGSGGDCWPPRAHRFCAAGPAQISYRGETETIADGKSYRVRLNDSDDGTPGEPDAKKPGRHGKALVLIVVGATVGAGVAALWGGNGGTRGSIESPDRP
jgi:hypothetical protein